MSWRRSERSLLAVVVHRSEVAKSLFDKSRGHVAVIAASFRLTSSELPGHQHRVLKVQVPLDTKALRPSRFTMAMAGPPLHVPPV